jgi:TetR/AcrR family transcriptional regulator
LENAGPVDGPDPSFVLLSEYLLVNTPPAAPALPSVAASAPRLRLSSDDRRRQLLSHAIDLFSKHGFSGTRTKDIAAACGVSEAILFRHFATKEDLYHAILDIHEAAAGNDEWLAEMQAMAKRRDDLGFIRCLLAQILKSFREDTAFHRLMLYAGLEGHSLPSMFHERMGSSMLEFLRSYVVLRQREGAFRKGDPDALVMLLASPALQYATSKYIFGIKTISRPEKEIAEEFAKLLLTALSPSQNNSRKTSQRKA